MAAVEPTDAEMQAFSCIEDVARWCHVDGDFGNEDSHLHSLFTHFGFAPAEPIRVVGSIPADEYNQELTSWTFLGIQPPFALRNKAKLFGIR